tara:strand:+ start:149 stop:1309 length:1161 start_codon:yes stop_codon:yes gene_type:complete
MKHLTYGGSTMLRTLNCTAWVSEAAKMPPNDSSSVFADEGTLLHNCMEEIMGVEGLSIPQLVEAPAMYGSATLTQELVATKINPAQEAIHELAEEYGFDPYDKNSVLVEPFVELIPDESGGSIDMLAVSDDGKTVLVIDYKFGHNTVSAENNAQLLFYALCADVDPTTADMFKHAEKLVLAIVQPNADGDVLDVWETPIDVLDQFEVDVYGAIKASKENPVHKAGTWCTYCPAVALCPLKTGVAEASKRLDPTQTANLSQALTMVPEIEAWIKAVNKLAYEQLESGVAIDGFKLVNKRASRVWSREDEIADKIRKMRKVPVSETFTTKIKSPAQMEKLFKEKGVDTSVLSDYITSVSSGTTVAKASDKRPDATPTRALQMLADRLK